MPISGKVPSVPPGGAGGRVTETSIGVLSQVATLLGLPLHQRWPRVLAAVCTVQVTGGFDMPVNTLGTAAEETGATIRLPAIAATDAVRQANRRNGLPPIAFSVVTSSLTLPLLRFSTPLCGCTVRPLPPR